MPIHYMLEKVLFDTVTNPHQIYTEGLTQNIPTEAGSTSVRFEF